MSKGNETVLVGVTVSLGLLLLVGAGVGGYLLVKKVAHPDPAYAPGAQQGGGGGLVVGNGVVAPVGSSNAAWSVQQAADAERKREEAWRKADKISQLERDLANAQNEIKRLTDQLNVIDGTPMPADIITRWSQQHLVDCKRSRFLGIGCEKYADLSDGYQAKADADWDAQKQLQKRPILTRLSELNNTQLSIISNLAALGSPKQPVNVRTT